MKPILAVLFTCTALMATAAVAAEPKPSEKPPIPHRGHLVAEMDTNKDGAVSKEEWQAKGEKMFAEIDANKDSKLSEEEIKAHYQLKRAMHDKRRLEAPKDGAAMKDGPASPAKK